MSAAFPVTVLSLVLLAAAPSGAASTSADRSPLDERPAAAAEPAAVPHMTDIPDDPRAPDWAGWPGLQHVNARCGQVDAGRGVQTVQLTYRYEWLPVSDTRGDVVRNPKDGHGWVLTSESWRAWPADLKPTC